MAATTHWSQRFWRNTLSSYARVFVRLLTGLVLFRLLYGGLDAAEFGYWSLLWSVFGYGVLLDFGLGFTVQRAVARADAAGTAGLDELNRLVSTVFWAFAALGALLGLAVGLAGPAFLAGVDTPPEHRETFLRAWWIFALGLGLNLPLGVFPEILRGRQRMDLANALHTAFALVNFGVLWAGVAAGWDLSAMVAVALATTLLPNALAGLWALRLVPGLSLAPRRFTWAAVRGHLGFSLVAYLITFSNLLMARSDQLVIGLALGVAAVAVYQAGYKMGEMLNLFTIQLQEALSPAAAALHAGGDADGLRRLLVFSTRLTVLLTTPLYLLSAAYLEPLIALLTGLETVPAEAWWTGQILLLAVYSSQLTNSATKRVLMMCGHERSLLGLSVLDALLNVALSILLAYQMGVVGVALGTLLPTAAVGWFLVLPRALKFAGVGAGAFARETAGPAAPALAPAAAVLAGLLAFLPAPPNAHLLDLGWRGLLVLAPVLWLGRRLLRPKL